jgi:hypothetical protein
MNDYIMNQLIGQCTPRPLDLFIAYQHAAVTTLTDIIFVLLPVFILWGANMTRRSKISAGFILCLAGVYVIHSP